MTRSGAHPETLYLDDNYYTGHGGAPGDIHTIPHELAGFPAAGQVSLHRPGHDAVGADDA